MTGMSEVRLKVTRGIQPAPSGRTRRTLLGVLSVLVVAAFGVHAVNALDAGDPRRGFGVNGPGPNEWTGSYRLFTGAGKTGTEFLGYCLDDGDHHPHGTASPESGFNQVADVPAQRGASLAERQSLAYILWRYGNTTDPVRAGDVHKAVGVLSKDPSYNDGAPPQWILDEGMRNRGPWEVHFTFTPNPTAGNYEVDVEVRGPGGGIQGQIVLLTYTNLTNSTAPEGIFGPYVITDANGRASFTAEPVDASQNVAVIGLNGDAPGPYKVYWGRQTTDGVATQRVITRSPAEMVGGATAPPLDDGEPPVEPPDTGAQVYLRKTTTNPAYQSGQGAVFTVYAGSDATGSVAATLTVGANGQSNIATLDAGTYHIVETSVPAGQVNTFTPRTVTLTDGQSYSFDAQNGVSEDGRIRVEKLDGETGEPLAGAVFDVNFDSDNNGSYETKIGSLTSTTSVAEMDGLVAGRYQVVEVAAPPGFLIAGPDQRAQEVVITYGDPGSPNDDVLTVTVTLDNFRAGLSSQVVDGTGSATNSIPVNPDGSIPPVADQILVSGVDSAVTGEVTTILYGPQAGSDPASFVCDSSTQVQSQTFDVVGPGPHVSPSFTVPESGIYTFVSTWAGENRETATHPCGVASETVSFPAIRTEVSAQSTALGEAIYDTATLTGVGDDMTGTIAVALYGPFASRSDIECAPGSEVWTSSIATTGGGVYTSESFTPETAGVYTFVETWTSTDTTSSATHRCGEETETTTVAPNITTEVSTQSSSFGGPISDTIVLEGVPDGFTGQITVDLFGPFQSTSDIECGPEPLWTQAIDTAGSGTFTSDEFTTETAGIYTYLASWAADSGDLTAAHECGAVSETTVAHPTITTEVSEQEVGTGSLIFDISTLSGVPDGFTGTSSFSLFGPFASAGDIECGPENLVGTVSAPTTGSGVTYSPTIQVSTAGIYTFVETWTSTTGEMTATHECGLPPETTTVTDDLPPTTPTVPTVPTTPPSGGGGGSSSGGGGGSGSGGGGGSSSSGLVRTGAELAPWVFAGTLMMGGGWFILVSTRRRFALAHRPGRHAAR